MPAPAVAFSAVSEAQEQDAQRLGEALAIVGDRWSLAVVAALSSGPRRFGEIAAELPAISTNVLSRRLRDLQRDGVVRAERYSERPPRDMYSLSGRGRDLVGVADALVAWMRTAEGDATQGFGDEDGGDTYWA
jgi:DNA-binding HxlR family transcriptional regulator